MLKRYLPLMLFIPLVAFTAAAVPEPSTEEVQANRLKWEELRKKAPERFARLYNEGMAFLELPAERRQQIIALDHDLHEESSSQQARLQGVLERYVEWLQNLSEADRLRVQNAPDKSARLAVVRELREQDWLKYQSKAIREVVSKTEGKARQELIAKLKKEDRQRRIEWQIAARFWKELENKVPLPSKLADFSVLPEYEKYDVVTYVKEYLYPMLSKNEKDRLQSAEGQWPQYPQTLVELADKHPPALLGPDGPKSFKELPEEVLRRMNMKAKLAALPKTFPNSAINHWPDFAIAFSNLIRNRNLNLPHEMWVHNENGLAKPMKDFLKDKLLPVLEQKEKSQLYQAHEGGWPIYPQTIQKLAEDHHLQPPWFTLPGPHTVWDNYRMLKQMTAEGFPEVPRSTLREFAQYELGPEELDRLQISTSDPEGLRKLTEIYFQRRPQELRKLRQVDQFKRKNGMILNHDGTNKPRY